MGVGLIGFGDCREMGRSGIIGMFRFLVWIIEWVGVIFIYLL